MFSPGSKAMIKAVKVGVMDPEAICVLIEYLAFENANLECKKILGPLKVRSAPIDKWILHIKNVETLDCSTEAWIGERISIGVRRHQNAKCFNCGRIGLLRRECRQRIPRNNVSYRNGKNSRTQHPGIYRRCGKC